MEQSGSGRILSVKELLGHRLRRWVHFGSHFSRDCFSGVTCVLIIELLFQFGPTHCDRFVGLVVKHCLKASASRVVCVRAEDLGFDSRVRHGDFFLVESYQ